MKWYTKLLICLLVIVFSPLILAFLLAAGISYLVQLPKNKKHYKQSRYYREFGLPYMHARLYAPEFRFFNHAKESNLQLTYIRQASNGLEYFIYQDTVFLFPDFDQVDLDEETGQWQANFDGDWMPFQQAYEALLNKLDADVPDLPRKLLVQRSMLPVEDLHQVVVPECIFLTWSYETALENEDSSLILKVPLTTQELYDMMAATPALCGAFQMVDGSICWELYENVQLRIAVEPQDCYIAVVKKSKIEREITHWHPTNFEIYEDVCQIGMPEKVLVLRSFLGGGAVLYMGDAANCPYPQDKKPLFGKQWYLRAERQMDDQISKCIEREKP